jgi:two-component system LytT family response regulator
MQLTCIAIDDEPLALEILKKYITEFPELKLLCTFEDAISAAEYLKKYKVDLLFIDIDMPDITGVDLVRALDVKPMIVFTTAHKMFAFEGFELEALDYLLKPIDLKRFSGAVHKAIDFAKYKSSGQGEMDGSLFVHSEYRMVKIELKEIEYIESMQDYIKIYLSNAEKPVLTLISMKAVLEKLPANDFERIHRSYIVATKKIKSIHNQKVRLKNIELPIGNNYANFKNTWAK